MKYIFILLTSILKQKPVQIVTKQVNWQKIFRYADYHNVNTIIYCAILGIEKEITEKMSQNLYQKYKKELLVKAEYQTAEEAIIWQLEQHHVHALCLSGTEKCGFYHKKEMGHIDSLEFLIHSSDVKKVQGLMEAMDYEKEEVHGFKGLLYVRTPGIRVRFLEKIPDAGRRVRKLLEQQPKGRPYVKRLTVEKQYIYNVTSLMEQYLLGNITVRRILDFRLYREKALPMLSKEVTGEVLGKSGMKAWEQCLIGLGELWFGEGMPAEDSDTVLALEEYILDPGKVDLALDRKVLPSSRKRLDFYQRDREEEWKIRKKGWMFPPREYMKEFFPILKKLPFLLIFCWGIRGIHISKKIAMENIRNVQKAILQKITKRKRHKGAKENEEDEAR